MRDQLAGGGFETFLPEVGVWLRSRGSRGPTPVPLFPGYLFLHHEMDKESYIRASRVRGLVRILGERWDRLAVVPDSEIESIATVLRAGMTPRPHPYLREGQKVLVRRGPLAGAEGILVRLDGTRGTLVLSVELFQRSLCVDVDCTFVEAA